MNFVPVIFGGYVNGYSIARTFYETYSIKAIICDYRKVFSYFSSLCEYIIVPDPIKNQMSFIEAVHKLGERLRKEGKIPLLIATNDEWLLPLSKSQDYLNEHFLYTFSEWDIIERLIIKTELYNLCEQLGIDYPKTIHCSASNTDRELDLQPPLLVKPSSVVEYVTLFPHEPRNNVFSSAQSARNFIENKFVRGFSGTFVVQEYIPGGVENLYTITTYSDASKMLKGASIGHKIMQFPPDAGTIKAGIIKYDSRLVAPAKKILESAGFFGITNIEFKYDCRYDNYKLIEVNPRPGMWNYSAFKSGLNLFSMMVDDLIFHKDVPYTEGKKPLVWTVTSNKMLLDQVKHLPESDTIRKLLSCKNTCIDPRINEQENLLYKAHLNASNLKSYFTHICRRKP